MHIQIHLYNQSLKKVYGYYNNAEIDEEYVKSITVCQDFNKLTRYILYRSPCLLYRLVMKCMKFVIFR